jgi:hypothetical protein
LGRSLRAWDKPRLRSASKFEIRARLVAFGSKQIEQARLKNELEALRMVAPLLEDGTAEIHSLPRAVNGTPQPDHRHWR